MAASVTYQIKGKYNNKAVKSAQSDLAALSKSIKGLGIAAWTKLSTELVKGLSNVVSGAADSFIQQNTAVKKLEASIKLSNKDFSELIKYQDKLSKNNFFDSDTLNNAQAMAINMGLNQKQVIAVMDAAEDLTAAGIMPLDQAVKALALSYSGNTTQLAKYIPQVKDLTTLQIKHGEAVDLIKEKYSGMADIMSETFEGRNTQFSNATGDLKNSIGGIIESLKYIEQGKWLEPINSMTSWLEENRETILKGIISFPQIAKEALSLVGKMIKTTLDPANLKTIFKDIGTLAITSVKALCNSMLSLFNVFFTQIGLMTASFLGKSGLFRQIDSWAGAIFNNLNSKIFGWIISLDEKIKELPEWMQKAIGFIEDQSPIGLFKKFALDSEGNLKKWNEDENWSGYSGYTNAFTTAFDEFEKTFEKEFNSLKPTLAAFGVDLDSIYADNLEDFGKTVEQIITTTELPEDLQNALTTMAANFSSGTTTGSGDNESGLTKYNWKSLLDGFKLTNIVTDLMNLVTGIENINNLLNPWETILQAMYDVIAPIVNEVLAPLVGMLKTIGSTMGYILIPLIQALEPVITLLSDAFVWLYNKIIVPVGNGIITVFVGVKNCMAKIINAIISVLNKLPGVDLDQIALANAENYKLSTIDTSTVASAGTASTSSTSSSSTSASSYTAARDIYVNINFDHSFVNGDATEIAIMLKNEIANVEKLGY